MNYREKIKAEHWNRKMWSRNEGKQEKRFDEIENPSLRIKVACVMLWDCTHHDVVEGRDFTLLKSYADKWKPQVEAEFEEQDLVDALHSFRYPIKIARKRAVPPKTNIDYRGGVK